MDLTATLRFYIDRMLREVKGMKVLLLDAETTRIVSTVYSQSEILEQEVYLVQRLDVDRSEQLLHLKVRFSQLISCSLSPPPSLPRTHIRTHTAEPIIPYCRSVVQLCDILLTVVRKLLK